MGLAETLKGLMKELKELSAKSIEKGLTDREYFSKIEEAYGAIGALLMILVARGQIKPEVAEELMQLKLSR